MPPESVGTLSLTSGKPQWYGKPLKQRGLLSRQGGHSSSCWCQQDSEAAPRVSPLTKRVERGGGRLRVGTGGRLKSLHWSGACSKVREAPASRADLGSSRQGVTSHGDLSKHAKGSVLEHGRLREIQNRFCRCAASPEELARVSSSNLVDA